MRSHPQRPARKIKYLWGRSGGAMAASKYAILEALQEKTGDLHVR
jgi:hypothetical protein